jgi:hypothetical protein
MWPLKLKFMKTLKQRVLKNKVTTIIGFVLLLGSAIIFYVGKISWQEFTAFIPFCLTMLWAKDTIIGINPTTNK